MKQALMVNFPSVGGLAVGLTVDRRCANRATGARLDMAEIILLLISPSFMASHYCYDVEMQRAMERYEAGEARVIPIIVRPVDWQGAPFCKLQVLPVDAKPVTSWKDRDEAFLNIALGIRRAAEEYLRPARFGLPPSVGDEEDVGIIWEPLRQPPIRILHLSDLHMDSDGDPITRLQPLIADLKDKEGGLGFDRLDYLVLSGDLTNRATAQEFDRAYHFISRLIARFELSAQRCIIVPGNHDLSWDEEVYNWKPKRKVDTKTMGSYVPQGDGFLIRDENKYHLRFENFGKFYHSLVQQGYPLRVEEQCLSFLFDDTEIQVLAMNSAWEIDEFFPERSSINEAALSNGLIKADEQIRKSKQAGRLAEDAKPLRIAVWHHPVTGNEKMVKDAFLERLKQADVKVCLHGHAHEDRADLIGYLHPTRQIRIAGAGTFGAPAKNRPESAPRLYNLIEIERDRSRIRIYTRCMRKDGGAWEGWAVWPGENANERRAYYDIET